MPTSPDHAFQSGVCACAAGKGSLAAQLCSMWSALGWSEWLTDACSGVQVLQAHEPVDEAAAARLFAAMARYPDTSSSGPEHESLLASLAALSIGFRPEVPCKEQPPCSSHALAKAVHA